MRRGSLNVHSRFRAHRQAPGAQNGPRTVTKNGTVKAVAAVLRRQTRATLHRMVRTGVNVGVHARRGWPHIL